MTIKRSTRLTLSGVGTAAAAAVLVGLAGGVAHAVDVYGTAGADHLYGSQNADSLYGFGGYDEIYAGAGADAVYAGGYQDYVEGGAGGDHLVGGPGGDVLLPGRGPDSVNGANGIDTIELHDDGAADHVSCGAGYDTVIVYGAGEVADVFAADCEDVLYYPAAD